MTDEWNMTSELYWLEMSGNVFFNPIPSHSQWFIPIPIPRFSVVLFPFPSHSHWLFPFPPAPIPIRADIDIYSASSLRLCCWSSSGSQRSLKSKTMHFLARGLWQSSVSLSAEVPWEGDVAPLTGWFSSSDYKWENMELSFPPIPIKPFPFRFPFPWN